MAHVLPATYLFLLKENSPIGEDRGVGALMPDRKAMLSYRPRNKHILLS